MVRKTGYRKKLSKRKIIYNIDSVNFNEDQSEMLIQGWAISKTNVKVDVDSKKHGEITIQKCPRADVMDYYQLKDAHVGFAIKCSVAKKEKYIPLKFVNETGTCIKVRVSQKKKNKVISTANLQNFYLFSKQYGVLAAIKHAIHVLLKRPTIYDPQTLSIPDQYRLYKQPLPLSKKEVKSQHKEIEKFKYKPLISILVPIYNVPEKWLRKCIDSVLKQTYENFELCLVDDASPNVHIKKVLTQYKNNDARIKVLFREVNGHISRTSNDALKLASGEFVALLDHDDELTEDALYEMVNELNKNPKLDMIYSDEDKVTMNLEYTEPHYKPDWSPDTFMSSNYICHFTMLRKSIVEKIGGFRVGFEGAQDYDLFLRFTECTTQIKHIPKILYHWRTLESSTASNSGAKNYAHDAGAKALAESLVRREIKGFVEPYKDAYRVRYNVMSNKLISIIIPTKDHADILEVCLKSIYEKTTYQYFEIIVISNDSTEQELFELLEKYSKEYKNFRWYELNIPFNYSILNNDAVNKAEGDYILLLNNDIEVITPNWLELMIGYASQKHIGAVGAKLLYPDQTVQHCGVVLGMGGLAAHIYKGAISKDDGYFYRLSVPYNYGAVTAACLMVSKEKWDEVKGLEEELTVAFNDVDFNMKLLRKNYYNVVLPQVQLYHHESKSRGSEDTPEKIARFSNEINYMKTKWKKELIIDKCYNPNLDLSTEQVSLKL